MGGCSCFSEVENRDKEESVGKDNKRNGARKKLSGESTQGSGDPNGAGKEDLLQFLEGTPGKGRDRRVTGKVRGGGKSTKGAYPGAWKKGEKRPESNLGGKKRNEMGRSIGGKQEGVLMGLSR